ncbi:hypothetical protein AB0J90_05390 [Micromonospora sp. NPDC049523]|uniref:hypothetical protein n=1 Tax=Micromonospora sp. NPDC049523 TaxID=3155921 RepID=UPI00341250DD
MSMAGVQVVSVEQALGVVGVGLAQLRTHAGSVLADGRSYLVGSLAAGFGNRGSDIDIHLFRSTGGYAPPYLMFVGDVPVDLEHFPDQAVGDLLAQVTDLPVAATPFGPVALTNPLSETDERRLIRWLTALPLDPESGPVLPPQASADGFAVLLRAVVDRLVTMVALAELAEEVAAEGAPYLWARAGRLVLEVTCTGRGSAVTGEKWLPARLDACGVPVDTARRMLSVTSGEEFAAATGSLGLPAIRGVELTTVRPDPAAREVSVGRQRFLLTRHERVYPEWVAAAGATAAVRDDIGAAPLLSGLRTGQIVLDVSTDALRDALCR